MCKTIAIIPAAGSGVRMGADRAKQFLELNGRPILAATLEPFQMCPAVDEIIVVAPAGDLAFCRDEIVVPYGFNKVQKVVAGGPRRQDSVRLGLLAIEGGCEFVLIHDGVRPLIQVSLIDRIIRAAEEFGAVITGLPAKETVKEVDLNHAVTKTHDRAHIWLIQTPQVFPYEAILTAHLRAQKENWPEMTDDAALLERLHTPVKVLEGSEHNIKVTTPHDLAMADFLFGFINE